MIRPATIVRFLFVAFGACTLAIVLSIHAAKPASALEVSVPASAPVDALTQTMTNTGGAGYAARCEERCAGRGNVVKPVAQTIAPVAQPVVQTVAPVATSVVKPVAQAVAPVAQTVAPAVDAVAARPRAGHDCGRTRAGARELRGCARHAGRRTCSAPGRRRRGSRTRTYGQRQPANPAPEHRATRQSVDWMLRRS